MKELDELKERCVQAMKDIDSFVDKHYDELLEEMKQQHAIPDDWDMKIVSNCGVVYGCYRQSDKDKWFRVIYNNGFWLDNNFL